VIHCFVPVSDQPVLVLVAAVRIAAASEPASGSLSANAPAIISPLMMRGTQCFSCASLP
jgi:hypothetical protein